MNNYFNPYCNCGCCNYLQPAAPTCNQMYQVTNTCSVQDYPHVMNYHTHNVNNLVRRHYEVPKYSYSESTQVYDEYTNQMPMMPYNQMPIEPVVPYNNINPVYPNAFEYPQMMPNQMPMEVNIYNEQFPMYSYNMNQPRF